MLALHSFKGEPKASIHPHLLSAASGHACGLLVEVWALNAALQGQGLCSRLLGIEAVPSKWSEGIVNIDTSADRVEPLSRNVRC